MGLINLKVQFVDIISELFRVFACIVFTQRISLWPSGVLVALPILTSCSYTRICIYDVIPKDSKSLQEFIHDATLLGCNGHHFLGDSYLLFCFCSCFCLVLISLGQLSELCTIYHLTTNILPSWLIAYKNSSCLLDFL